MLALLVAYTLGWIGIVSADTKLITKAILLFALQLKEILTSY